MGFFPPIFTPPPRPAPRSIAEAADEELRQAGRRPEKLAECGDQLRKCFSVSLQAPGKARGGNVSLGLRPAPPGCAGAGDCA